jgi:hypothetical protein
MKNYLSFGGGVNSVALYLLMQDMGMEFEAVYVDHGGDWPETLEYVAMFAKKYPLTVLKPNTHGVNSLLDYCDKYRIIPARHRRWCTEEFKVNVMFKYYERPCFVHLGIDAGEPHRARMSGEEGQENRYILIEEGIDRAGCEKIIIDHGLPVPMKSGCWFCPFQRIGQWRLLRHRHPCLFAKAVDMEEKQNQVRAERGKVKPFNFIDEHRPLASIINEKQTVLPGLEQMEYPPCQCGL